MPDLPVSPPSPRGLDPQVAAVTSAPLVDERLANGARLLVLPARPAGSGPAAIQLWVASGTAAERPDEHGCAHLLEHMLFKPCALGHGPKSNRARLAAAGVRRAEAALDLAGAIEALGGDINAFTSHDETVVHVTAPAARAAEAAALIATAALYPTLDPATLAQEREVVIEEIKQYDDDPGQRVTQAALARVYGGHAYARPVLGLEAEVAGHTAARLRAYHRRAYAGSRLTLVAVGAVDVAALRKVARAIVGTLPAAKERASAADPAPRPGVTLRRAKVQETYALLAWPAPAAGAAGAAAIDAAAVVLGSGESSRLVAETRRKDQVVSDIQAHCDTLRLGGAVMVSARTTAAQAGAAVAAVLAQVARLAQAPVSAEELARARAILESDLVYRRETVQGQAHALGACATIFGDLAREREYYAALAALTPEAVRETCARWLDPARACVSLELPAAELDGPKARSLKTAIAAGLKPAPKPARGPAPKRAPDGIEEVTLAGGLRLVARVERSVPVAAGWLIWPGGQRREPLALAGSNSVVAALLTRGNARVDGEALSRAIDGMAAGLDGFAGRNSLGLRFECLARHFPTVLGYALDCATTPRFAADELEEERRVALQDLAAEVDDPGQVAARGLHALLYGEHPFSRPVRGTPAGLRALTPAKLRGLWRRDYPMGQAVLALAGDVDVAAAAAQVESALREAGLEDRLSERPGKPKPVKAPTGSREREIFQDREQAHIALGWPGIAVGDAREPTLDVLSAVLGGQTGRLFTALREVQGLVYEVSMSSVEGLDAGHVAIHASTSQDKLPKALAAIFAEVERASKEPPSPAEVERAQAWLVGQFELGQQRRSRMASLLALSEVYGLPRARALAYPQRVAAVTAEGVWALARTLFRPQVAARCVVRARRRKE